MRAYGKLMLGLKNYQEKLIKKNPRLSEDLFNRKRK